METQKKAEEFCKQHGLFGIYYADCFIAGYTEAEKQLYSEVEVLSIIERVKLDFAKQNAVLYKSANIDPTQYLKKNI
jgi:hypothetical protein